MPTIKMVDAAKFYKGLPGQVEAFQLLDKLLTEEQKIQFQDLYRKASPVVAPAAKQDIYLYCNWSGKYDSEGLKIFGLYLMNGDRVVDKLVVCSGQAYAQDVVWPEDDYSGSMRPCPEGVYDLGAVDDLGYDPGSSDGYGRWVIPLEPRFPLQRSLLRGHGDRNRATSPGCFPKDEVEVLTQQGWVSAADYGGQPVAQLIGDELVFEEVYGVIDSPYKGKMIEFKSNQLNMMMTPNHRVALRAKGNNEGIRYLPAAEVSRLSSADILITGVLRNTDGVIDVLEARWMACVMADGHYPRNGKPLEFHFKKERKIERIQSIASELNIDLTIRPVEKTGATRILCERRFPVGMTEDISKDIDPNIALKMTPEARRAFLMELEHWDGSNIGSRSFKWDGTNKTHRDLILFVAALSGYRTSTHLYKSRNLNWKDQYRVYLAPRTSYKLTKPEEEGSWVIDWHQDWEGQVWCLETKTTNFLVRHRDRVFITGNSAGCVCPYFEKDMAIWVGWLRSKAKPTYLIMDHGLGYLKEQGVKVPSLKK